MPKKDLPKRVALSVKQANALKERLSNKSLNDEDVKTLLGVLSFNLWMQDQLSRAKLSIKRLRGLFGFSRESQKKGSAVDVDASTQGDEDESDATNPTAKEPSCNNVPKDNSNPSGGKGKNYDPSKNHGRYGSEDYPGCPIVPVPFDEKLQSCPDCARHETDAKLYSTEPQVLVLLDSVPLVHGHRYQLDRARCSVCQTYFTAPLPASVQSKAKYSYSSKTSIAIYHYYAGVPFKRLEMLQAAQGVPLPDSTQYDLMKRLYKSVISPISDALRLCAANGQALYFDDTPGRIVEQTLLNSQASTKKAKQAVHATALLSDFEDHRIYLFDTNTQTAGKQLKSLLSGRTKKTKFLTMSDASANNFPMMEDDLMARWIISLCLSHGRRRFVELLGDADEDIVFILDLMAKVYINDRHCKEKKLTPGERLKYHQQHSGPVMAAMFTWFNNLLLYKTVEPNSRFGEAILYMIKRWDWLTQFLHEPGASLDNNICEQAIKVMIRYRNNSLFYRTFYGANIGDAMMSVLHTAINADVNVFDYLNTLQANEAAVQAEPEKWLPWCYQQTRLQQNKAAQPPHRREPVTQD